MHCTLRKERDQVGKAFKWTYVHVYVITDTLYLPPMRVDKRAGVLLSRRANKTSESLSFFRGQHITVLGESGENESSALLHLFLPHHEGRVLIMIYFKTIHHLAKCQGRGLQLVSPF